MVTITLNNLTNLNTSLQVGDAMYSVVTFTPVGSQDARDNDTDAFGNLIDVGSPHLIGILRRITIGVNEVTLDIDETPFFNPHIPQVGEFLMFSKWDQTDGDVVGYYAQANFINDSKEPAELFSVGSEVIINSK